MAFGIPTGKSAPSPESAARSVARGDLVPEARERARDPDGHASAARAMFDRIAPTYDVLNKVMTAGIDRRWRSRAVAALHGAPPGAALDLCAGTLDLAALLERAYPSERVVACDFSAKMLDLGRRKVDRTEVLVADALALPFDDASFTRVICGFGMRNLADLRRGVREVRRVLGPGGVFVTLELFAPALARSKAFHAIFARRVLPAMGRTIARDEEAYGYLSKSMLGFATRAEYEDLLREEGFAAVHGSDLTLGVASIVRAEVARGSA
jgi:ubiquinone/menaquinone biosynthesis methyltransferase